MARYDNKSFVADAEKKEYLYFRDDEMPKGW